MALIIGSQAWNIVPFMFEHDKYPDYYYFVLPAVYGCDVGEFGIREDAPTRNALKWWINCASWEIFSNPNTIPLIFSIGVMPLVYLLGYYLTKDRIIGIISLVAFVFNPLYKSWTTSGTYDMVWAFFLILGVILAIQKPKYAVFSFGASILSKTLAILYLPMFLYTILQGPMRHRARLWHAGIAAVLIVGGGLALSTTVNLVGSQVYFREDNVINALFSNFFTLWQVLPFLLGLVVVDSVTRSRFDSKRLVWVWMIGIMVLNPLPMLFSEQMQYSYRLVPFAVFMSIYAAMVITGLGNFIVEKRMSQPIKNIH